MATDLDQRHRTERHRGDVSVLAIIGRTVGGLAAGFVGFYAGLFVMLSIFGLEAPSEAAIAMVAGACLFGFVTVAAIAALPAGSIVSFGLVGLLTGALAGYVNEATVDSFELGIGLAAVLIIGAAIATTAYDAA